MLCWKWKHGKGSHRVGVNIQSLIQNKVYRDNYKPIQNYKSIRKVELACNWVIGWNTWIDGLQKSTNGQ